MTTQSRLQARIDFEREMTEYYEAAGLDRQAERSRNLAAELADEYRAVTEPESDRPVPFMLTPQAEAALDAAEPEPEAEL